MKVETAIRSGSESTSRVGMGFSTSGAILGLWFSLSRLEDRVN